MSVHVLLNLLNLFYLFFATTLINSIYRSTNIRFYLAYDIKIILK